ncbi:hypothetical protein [Mesonia aquimarina]|nr:hypothetical protein [Mesonia aquimarina]
MNKKKEEHSKKSEKHTPYSSKIVHSEEDNSTKDGLKIKDSTQKKGK